MHHGQRESRGHGGINGVAALPQNCHSGIRGQMVNAHHHSVLRAHRLLGQVRDCICGALLPGCGDGNKQNRAGGEAGYEPVAGTAGRHFKIITFRRGPGLLFREAAAVCPAGSRSKGIFGGIVSTVSRCPSRFLRVYT